MAGLGNTSSEGAFFLVVCVTKRPWLWKGVPAHGGNEPPLTDKREQGYVKLPQELQPPNTASERVLSK